MSANICRWGICSASRISADFVTALRLGRERHSVVAVAARDLDRAQEFAQRFEIDRAYDNYEDLAKDKDVDVIYIGTINQHHKDLAVLCMKNHKPVLCEKPLAMNIAQIEEMQKVSKENQVFFVEALWSRFNPLYTKIKDTIESGALGEIRLVQATLCLDLTGAPQTYNKLQGGGAMFAIGIYPLNFAQWVYAGEYPEHIEATGALWPVDETDQWANITLKYKNGGAAMINYHSAVNGNTSAYISGTKGTLTIPSAMFAPDIIQINDETMTSSLPELNKEYKYNFMNSGRLIHEADHVRDCLQQNLLESPVMSHSDSLQLCDLMTQIVKKLGVV